MISGVKMVTSAGSEFSFGLMVMFVIVAVSSFVRRALLPATDSVVDGAEGIQVFCGLRPGV